MVFARRMRGPQTLVVAPSHGARIECGDPRQHGSYQNLETWATLSPLETRATLSPLWAVYATYDVRSEKGGNAILGNWDWTKTSHQTSLDWDWTKTSHQWRSTGTKLAWGGISEKRSKMWRATSLLPNKHKKQLNITTGDNATRIKTKIQYHITKVTYQPELKLKNYKILPRQKCYPTYNRKTLKFVSNMSATQSNPKINQILVKYSFCPKQPKN